MFENIEDFKIAVGGGGRRCKLLLESVYGTHATGRQP